MEASEEFIAFTARLASFEAPQRLPKRRASSTKKKAPASIAWPHETPSPEDLANAGFHFVPNQDHPDNVKCFVCDVQIDGWEPQDKPTMEHLTLAPDCGWAINACIRVRVDNSDREEEDPLSEKMIKARKDTFLNRWPHEGKRAWRCKTQKMVEAGWCYDPSPECDDGVTCPYCNVSLDGWEPKDNPLEEHRKRSPDCLFFALVEEHASTRKSTKPKRARASKASTKAQRLSTQSNFTTFSEAPSLASLGDDGIPVEGDSVLTTATVATTASSKGKKSKAKGAPKATKRSTRSRANTVTSEPAEQDDTVIDAGETTSQEVEPIVIPKRSTRRNTNLADASALDSTAIEAANPPRKTSRAVSRSKKPKAKPKQRMSEDESQLQSELLESIRKAEEASPKLTRGTKRTSTGAAKLDSSVILSDDAPPVVSEPQPKAKRGRKPKNSASQLSQPTSEVAQVDDEPQAKTKAPPKTRKGRSKKASKPVEPVTTTEDPLPEEHPPAPSVEDEVQEEFPPVVASPLVTSPVVTSSTLDQPAMKSPEPEVAIFETENHTPTQGKSSPSPQSSDAENKPPSSRPSTIRSSLPRRSGDRIPLADTTPTASPSKRPTNRLGGGLQSATPWESVELEAIFLASPTTNRMRNQLFDSDAHKDAASLGQEAFPPNLPLKDVIRKVKEGLTSPEKKMTVEEWIMHNAKRGEEKMRVECERMVGIFETHGERAMRTLESIECAR